MKKTLIVLSVLFFSFTTVGDNPMDKIGVKGPLEFGKTSFKLAWTDKPNDKYYLQEYLPEGEKLESFNQMLAIRLFDTDLKTKDAVRQKVSELIERKKSDEICNYEITESPDSKEFIIDFMLGESKDDQLDIIEFNVYRYKQIEIAKRKKAVIIYSFSKRSYGKDIPSFLKTLNADRTAYIEEMIMLDVPMITIEKK